MRKALDSLAPHPLIGPEIHAQHRRIYDTIWRMQYRLMGALDPCRFKESLWCFTQTVVGERITSGVARLARFVRRYTKAYDG